jgi:hypothetical protein
MIGDILYGLLRIPPLIDRLNELSAKDVALEDLPAEVDVPGLGRIGFEVTARKLLIQDGTSAKILVNFHRVN